MAWHPSPMLLAMIAVPESFREMPRWWADPAGQTWLEFLPERAEDRCRRWGLSVDGAVMHGSNALVVPVRRGAQPLVLRLAPPGDDVVAEAAALRVWDGRGTVCLYDVDEGDGAMLLERLNGRRTLAGEPLEYAIKVLAGLVSTLAIPVPASVQGTDQIASEHLENFEREWSALNAPFPRQQLDAAISCAAERSAVQTLPFAVDGDLHFDQVLAGTREPWVVVDPVLLRGDPEYDLARILSTGRNHRRRRGSPSLRPLREHRERSRRPGTRMGRHQEHVLPPMGTQPRAHRGPAQVPTTSRHLCVATLSTHHTSDAGRLTRVGPFGDPLRDNPRSSGALPDTLELVPVAVPHAGHAARGGA